MASDEFSKAANKQTRETARDIEEGHTAEAPDDSSNARTERIVLRVSKDELHRIKRFYDKENMPVSTSIRALVLNHIRRSR